MIHKKTVRRSNRAAFFGARVSFVALVAAIPAQAWAQCSPDPSQSGTAVICSGSDTNGYTISTSASPLTVNNGASVSNSGAPAITVSIPSTGNFNTRSATITVNGTVTGSGGAGISVLSGPLGSNSYDYYGTNATITVGSAGAVSGTYGITATQSSGNSYGGVTVSIDNAGSISGTSGVALYGSNSYGYFSSVTNRTGGTIGAIQANVGSINNVGTIDGGALSAIAPATGTTSFYGGIGNSGTITSASTAATIANYNSTITNAGTISNTSSGAAINAISISLTNLIGGTISAGGANVIGTSATNASIYNWGAITNTGTGTAIAVNGALSVTNNAGGIISTAAGNTVLSTTGALNLVNSGSIIGNVSAGSGTNPGGSTIDSTAGTITGNLTLGSGNDTLIATLKNGSLYTGISGVINGGGGTNTVQLKTTADTTLSSAVSLPTNFTVLDFVPTSGTTVTLANGFSNAGMISFDGSGTLNNQTTLSGSGQIIGQSGYSGGGTFRNDGTISTTNPLGDPAVGLTSASINNTGTISASGAGVVLSSGNNFINSGTITAQTVAASLYVGGTFTNTGTIRSVSSQGLSLTLSGSGTNSGAISGASIALALKSGTLVNTGTISGNDGVTLSSYATIDNEAGGTITGGSWAINNSGFNFNARVINAGTINGNVDLVASGFYTGYVTSNIYWSKAGGVLNGNLALGNGDMLITSLTGSGTSGYAGINGTVNAKNSVLRYDVTADASDTLAAHAGFTTLGYQVASGATLTLGTNGTYGSTVTLAGQGNVVLNGTVSTSNAAALTTASVIQQGNSVLPTALTITNNGALASTRGSTSSYTGTVLLPSGYSYTGTGSGIVGSTFINNGQVSFTDTTGTTSPYAAVSSLAVVNNGSISAAGGNGVSATTLTNSGSITATGNAFLSTGSSTINNSGTLTSTAGAAIRSSSYSSTGDTLNNLAGGSVTGVGTAVQMIGGLVNNAGTINGNVNLGYTPAGGANSVSGMYIANGGTLNGDLAFGGGNAILVETGSGFGVTGTITAGSGTNWIGHQRSGTATVTLGSTLPSGFTNEFTVAAGSTSKVTLTGPSGYAGNLYVGGAGTIINQVATAGSVYGVGYLGNTPYAGIELAGFLNQANVRSVSLSAATFSNTASIGSSSLAGAAVTLSTANGFTFSNSGAITNDGNSAAVLLSGSTANSSSIANSGTIIGGMNANLTVASGNSVSITNTGAISGYQQPLYVAFPRPPYYLIYVDTALTATAYGAKNLTLNNSGMITGAINLGGSAATLLNNSGTINGAMSLTGGDVTLINSGTITGAIMTGAGNDSLILGGVVTGAISTGDGDDSIALNGVFSGSIDGGAGTNKLSISSGTQAAPVALTFVRNIGAFTQTGGFATVSGSGTFGTATLTGGRLVGLAGSILNADSFNVGSNATFGSAGTVNGNVVVSGTLSPGASPGTMTVNGNVTLNGGSTSLFEITPTVSDKLIVNGKMTILPGSTLQIAATGPVKVGSTLDLITASGGVSGTYDTVTGLAGSVRTLANGDLGLLVQFANPDSYNPQLRRAVAYVNSAMAASSAPAALNSALSALQDGNGAPIASAFARLTPEPYADALQIGTETALSLSGNARTLGEGEANGPTHIFAFGQGLGSLRQFASRETQGVSHATINGFGALGGLGLAGQDYAFSAYVGWMDQSQSISALSASTKARGVVGGVAARFGGATRITLSANYDAAHALTRRYVPDAGTISTAYSLPSWSFDASISHAVPLGQGWMVRPQVGTTWVTTSHDAINEASAHPFALSVDKADITQGFVDAGLGFETAPDATGPWRRFLTLGVRYRVQGDQMAATAALAGYSSSLAALGVGRNRVDATMAAGVEYRLAPGASLFLNASGELGKASKRESVTAGVRFRL
ncbi:hypothetical protein [Novosphingobium rosa]|uniref:hypothetical protein n=1 Tax=Novosphingobium rosa TaxID=76978 RepID=UPI000AE758BB|nr:hypothetical protein [Novosphingobium rosa]